MKSQFHEDFQSPKADPMDAHSIDFDWAGLYRALGEETDGETELTGQDLERLAFALQRVLTWIIGEGRLCQNLEARIGRRAIALCWAVSPAYIEGSPSLSEIAQTLGCHKQSLSQITTEFSREFGVRNRAQHGHGWNFVASKGALPPANRPVTPSHQGKEAPYA